MHRECHRLPVVRRGGCEWGRHAPWLRWEHPHLPHSGPLAGGTAGRGWGAMPQDAAVGTAGEGVITVRPG